jgi:DNA-binding MarR family transcriptional regulator
VAETGLRQVLVALLFVIEANPGIYQGRVGEALGIKRGNMVSLANELQEKGLVERKVPPGNRRAFSLAITSNGQATLEHCLRRIREHEDRLLAPLTYDERTVLVDLLRKIMSNSLSSP